MNKYQAVENVVYKHYNRSVNDIRVKCRRIEYKIPRFITWYMNDMYYTTNNCQQSINYIRTPTTIRNGIMKVNNWCDTDKTFKLELERIDDLVRKELGLRVKIPTAKFGTRTSVTVNIYTCFCKALIYTNKEKGYCTQCGTHLKFEV